MLNTSKIIAFVSTINPVRARAFYEHVLGLILVSDEPFALVFDANGTMLRVTKVQELPTAKQTILGWDVPDICAEVELLTQRGVVFEWYDGFPQDELGIASFPDATRVAWFKDPDGNLLSITQFR